jgi:hypothetical protein
MIRSYETKSLTNQMSKDETKKKINHTKGSKIIRVKIKKKKWIRGQIKIFNWRVKLNWKIALTKRKKNQKNKGQNENNKTTKTLIEWWNWK